MNDKLDELDHKMLEHILDYGWSDISVFPTKESPGLPFNYTVGLTLSGHPELIIMGMDNQQMHGVLSSACQAIMNGTVFESGSYVATNVVLQQHRVAFVAVTDVRNDEFPLTMAERMYHEFSALQLVWPDSDGRFPWDEDFAEMYRDRQVLLGPWEPRTEPSKESGEKE